MPHPLVSVLTEAPDLTARGLAIFLTIAAQPGQSTKAVAEAVGCSAPAVTRWTDALAAAGLIAKAVDPMDRRCVLLTLTPAGEAFHARICAVVAP